jgi:hypothetical protein
MLNILIYDLSNKLLLIQGGIIVSVHWSIREYQMLEFMKFQDEMKFIQKIQFVIMFFHEM